MKKQFFNHTLEDIHISVCDTLNINEEERGHIDPFRAVTRLVVLYNQLKLDHNDLLDEINSKEFR